MTTTIGRPPIARADVRTTSAEQTRDLAAALANVARPGDRIALLGPLGAGKTQFAKGFAAGLGVKDVVNSPSFTLMAEYEGRLRLFHEDLYRLNGAEDVIGGGLIDERQQDGVTLIEWGDRMPDKLDAERLIVHIAVNAGDDRTITVIATKPSHARYARAAGTWSAS